MESSKIFFAGVIVICKDNENVESLVEKNEYYTVREVTHRGALIKLKGVSASLASSRFVPMNVIPPSQTEFANASNS